MENSKKANQEELKQVTGGLRDASGHEIACPKCGTQEYIHGQNWSPMFDPNAGREIPCNRWKCRICNITFYTSCRDGSCFIIEE